MGLFFPALRLEQAHFLLLTTCQTIDADHMNKFGVGAGMLERLFFDYAVQILRFIFEGNKSCFGLLKTAFKNFLVFLFLEFSYHSLVSSGISNTAQS